MLNDDVKTKDGKPDLKKVRVFLQYVDEQLDGVEDKLSLKGKTLARAEMENSSHQCYYDSEKAKINSMIRWLELHIDKRRGDLYRYYTENHSRDLSERAKERFIDTDEEIFAMNETLIDLKEAFENYAAVVDAFRSRGFRLRDITELRVNQLQDDSL